MKKIDVANINYDDLFEACVTSMQQPRQAYLRAAKPQLDLNNNQYETHAGLGSLYQVSQHTDITSDVGKDDMVYLYDGKLLDKGRDYYNLLLGAAPYDTCPFCSQRKVKSLDHYLPKTLYPSFSITPLNLIPCCSDCNKDKGTKDANTASEQFLHPYFDDLNGLIWLKAELTQRIPISFVFSVVDISSLDSILYNRILHQFEVLNLGALYASHAAEEFENIRRMLVKLQSCPDDGALAKYLQMQLDTYKSTDLNSWATAMYEALLNSEWFLEMDLDY
ncbi:MAG: hypothetical protein QF692_08860 [Alphaproteobacteria bacterium]|nr:hypothetical protein [Alphaproteobacteria bacterium]MDP7223354.1 hypothetical protein [Alphaproteobacteria bacterium]